MSTTVATFDDLMHRGGGGQRTRDFTRHDIGMIRGLDTQGGVAHGYAINAPARYSSNQTAALISVQGLA
jgi:hypothetical protein